MTLITLTLLIAFQFKHLIADYYLQFPYMYENKGKKKGWVEPLLHHAFIHGVFTMIIVAIYFNHINALHNSYNVWLFLGIFFFDVITHFITDRWKATRNGGPDTSKFWVFLGCDQMIHHIVGILIVFSLTNFPQIY